MGILKKIKKGIEHAVNEASGEVKKVVDGAYNTQKDVVAEVQKRAEEIINMAYNKQKEILNDVQNESERIINAAYEEQKKIINEAKKNADAILNKAADEIQEKLQHAKNNLIETTYNYIIIFLENKNFLFKLIALILKKYRDIILKEIKERI